MLTEKQISDYRQNGFVSGIRIMEPETAAEYRRQYEASFAHRLSFAMVDSNHKAASKFDIREFRPHLYFKWAADLMYTPALVDAVSALLGPDLLVWETRIFAKPAHSSSYISWHQDLTYWGLDLEYEEVTAWVALSPSNPESGCLPTQARPIEGRQFATLLSGKDIYNNFDLIESAHNNQPSDEEVIALARKLVQ